jgi:hypothetical protein
LFKKKIRLGGGLARSVLAALWVAIDFSSRYNCWTRVWTRVDKQFSGRHKLHFGPRAIRARDPRARYFPREIAI